MLHSIYSKKYVLHKKPGINLECTLISAVCHIKNNTSLGLYQHYFDSRPISKLLGQLAHIFYLLSSIYKNNVLNNVFNKFFLHEN